MRQLLGGARRQQAFRISAKAKACPKARPLFILRDDAARQREAHLAFVIEDPIPDEEPEASQELQGEPEPATSSTDAGAATAGEAVSSTGHSSQPAQIHRTAAELRLAGLPFLTEAQRRAFERQADKQARLGCGGSVEGAPSLEDYEEDHRNQQMLAQGNISYTRRDPSDPVSEPGVAA